MKNKSMHPENLIMSYGYNPEMTHSDIDDDEKKILGISDKLIHLSIGVEHYDISSKILGRSWIR